MCEQAFSAGVFPNHHSPASNPSTSVHHGIVAAAAAAPVAMGATAAALNVDDSARPRHC